MWNMRCGCNPILPEPFEFEIENNIRKYFDSDIKLPNRTDYTQCLKEKIIQDYLKIINQLECVIKPDLEILLEEISLVDMKNDINFNVAKEIYPK